MIYEVIPRNMELICLLLQMKVKLLNKSGGLKKNKPFEYYKLFKKSFGELVKK